MRKKNPVKDLSYLWNQVLCFMFEFNTNNPLRYHLAIHVQVQNPTLFYFRITNNTLLWKPKKSIPHNLFKKTFKKIPQNPHSLKSSKIFWNQTKKKLPHLQTLYNQSQWTESQPLPGPNVFVCSILMMKLDNVLYR